MAADDDGLGTPVVRASDDADLAGERICVVRVENVHHRYYSHSFIGFSSKRLIVNANVAILVQAQMCLRAHHHECAVL